MNNKRKKIKKKKKGAVPGPGVVAHAWAPINEGSGSRRSTV
jgi:hypothetical protein